MNPMRELAKPLVVPSPERTSRQWFVRSTVFTLAACASIVLLVAGYTLGITGWSLRFVFAGCGILLGMLSRQFGPPDDFATSAFAGLGYSAFFIFVAFTGVIRDVSYLLALLDASMNFGACIAGAVLLVKSSGSVGRNGPGDIA